MSSTFAPETIVADVRRDAPPELTLRVIAGAEGVTRATCSPRIRKLGLAGFAQYTGCVQIAGRSEVAFLEHVPHSEQRRAIERLPWGGITCVGVTKGLTPPQALLETLAEVAVRNHLLKRQGVDTMRQFVRTRDVPVAGDATDLR